MVFWPYHCNQDIGQGFKKNIFVVLWLHLAYSESAPRFFNSIKEADLNHRHQLVAVGCLCFCWWEWGRACRGRPCHNPGAASSCAAPSPSPAPRLLSLLHRYFPVSHNLSKGQCHKLYFFILLYSCPFLHNTQDLSTHPYRWYSAKSLKFYKPIFET